MAGLFEFGGDTGETEDSLKTKRAIALMLARNSGGVAHNAGEGLAKVGNALAFALAMNRLDSGQKDLISRQAGLWPALLGGGAAPTAADTSTAAAPTAAAPATPGNIAATPSVPAEALSEGSLVNTPVDISGGTLPTNAKATAAAPNINVPDQYKPLVEHASQQYGVPTPLLAKTLHTESRFNPQAVSPAGALGIAQFMPQTAKDMGVDPLNPASAIPGAAQYLAQNYAKYGSWPLALAAYNAGPGRVDHMLANGGDMRSLPAETQSYVSKIMGGLGNLLGPTQAQAAEAPQVSNPQLAAMLSPDMTMTGQGGFQPAAAPASVPLPQPRPADAPATFADRFAPVANPADQAAVTTELSPRARVAQALMQSPAVGSFTPQSGPEPTVTDMAVRPTTLPIMSGRDAVAQALSARQAQPTASAPAAGDPRRAAIARLLTPNPRLKDQNGQPISIAQAVALYGNPVQQKLVGTMMQNALVPQKPIIIGAGATAIDPVTHKPVFQSPTKPTTDILNYNQAVSQGYKGTFQQFETEMKNAGRPVNLGPAPKGYMYAPGADGSYSLKPIPGGPAAQAEAEQAGAKQTTTDVVSTAYQTAKKLIGLDTTGLVGKGVGSVLPSSQAAELRRQVHVLTSNASISALNAMRRQSKTGGALGNVTEAEERILAATAGAINPDSSPAQFKTQLDNYYHTLLRIVNGPEAGDKMFAEMQQGQPSVSAAQIPPPAQRQVGTVYDTPKGKARWMGNGWELVQ